MAQATPSVNDTLKDIGNTLYNSILIAIAFSGSRYISTKLAGFEDRPVDFKPKDIGVGTYCKGFCQSLHRTASREVCPTAM